MARGPSKRVVLNRAALDAVTLGEADGLFELAKEIVLDAASQAPDSPYDPYPAGEGLVKQGGALAYANGAKIAGWSQRGGQPAKPKALRGAGRGEIIVAGGFGFPALFVELGTLRTRAQPFLSPALDRRIREAAPYIERGVQARLAKVR
jgi:hypothetical protein